MDLGRGSRPINLNGLGGCSEGVTGVGFGPEGIDALGGGLFFGEEPLVTLSRAQSESSISKERCASGDDDSLVRLTSAAMPLEALEVVKRGSMTDEALHDEASKYVDTSSLSVGGPKLSSTYAGLASMIDGEEQLPLSIILVDGSNGELVTEGEKFLGGEGGGG